MPTSAVDFPTESRVHFGLAVRDLAASRRFYEQLLEMTATKVRDDYVKFESLNPPLNLTLVPAAAEAPAKGVVTHFGIQVKSTEEVASRAARLAALGLEPKQEESVSCCYAVQDKAWVTDPDGNSWEVFVVLDADAPELVCGSSCGAGEAHEPAVPCC